MSIAISSCSFFFVKQKTAYEMSLRDWSSDVCSSDLPREQTQDPARLASAVEEAQATFVQATPTTWRMLVDAGWEGLSELKIVCGGETLPRSLANELIDRGASLWNMYGPTETTIWSSALE